MNANSRKRLQKLIKEGGLSNSAFARKIGINPRTLSSYLSGTVDVPSRVLVDFADFFDVSTDYLLGRSGKSTSTKEKTEAALAKKGRAEEISKETMRAQAEINRVKRLAKYGAEDLCREYLGLSKEAVRALHKTRGFKIKWTKE